MTRLLPALSAVALFAAACEPAPEATAEDYSWVLPDDRILVDMETARRAAGDESELRTQSMEVAYDVNSFIDQVLTDIGGVTEFEPTWGNEEETQALWGPWTDNGIDAALYVQLMEDASYEWALIGKLEGASEDDWAPLVAGLVDAGATETTGSGTFAVDFDAISALGGEPAGTGLFVSTYDVRENTVDAQAAFEDFAENPDDPTVDAVYRYGNDRQGGYMDLAYEADATDGGELETYILRTRWVKGGAGRGDVYLTGGDLGPLVYQASECWDEGGTVVFDENNYELTTSGDQGDCAFAEAQWNEDGV